MTSGNVFIACSLDGFIARPDGDVDWLTAASDGVEDYGYAGFIAGMDGLVMGRGSYEKVLSFGGWPYEKPVVVLSQSLNAAAIPDSLRSRVRISRATPGELMEELADEGWDHAYIDGGQVISSFLRDGLISEMVIARLPILLGAGLPLFSGLADDIALRHIRTVSYDSGLVQTTYNIGG